MQGTSQPKRQPTKADEDFWDYYYSNSGVIPEVIVEYAPAHAVFSGVLDADGAPIYRHPVQVRMGFHMPDRKHWIPTLEDSDDQNEDDRTLGYVYAA